MSNEIFTRIQAGLVYEQIGAVIAASGDNVTYTAGYEVPSQVFPIRERLIFCILAASGHNVMLVPDMEYTLAKSASRFGDVRMYNEFTQNPIHELNNILEELSVSRERVAIEEDFVPYAALDQLYQLMPHTHFVPAHDFFAGQRMFKTPHELDLLRRVNKIAEQAHYYAAGKARAGITELQYAQSLSEYLFNNGVESINKLVVGAGERSEHPNANPTSRKLHPGELVRADIFAKIQGYLSDVARTAVVGSPTAEQRAKWEIVFEARNLILEQIRPGSDTREIYEIFCRHFEKAGLVPTNFVGHGLGITLHEDPYISRYHQQELQAGMVLAIEPMFFSNGEGYQLEEIVIVTADGAELITDCHNPQDLILIEP